MSAELHSMSEDEANLFAVCLLMPEEMLINEIRAIGPLDLNSDLHIAQLCKKFGVSPQVIGFRIAMIRFGVEVSHE